MTVLPVAALTDTKPEATPKSFVSPNQTGTVDETASDLGPVPDLQATLSFQLPTDANPDELAGLKPDGPTKSKKAHEMAHEFQQGSVSQWMT